MKNEFQQLVFVQSREVIPSFVITRHCGYAAPMTVDEGGQRDSNVTNFESLFDILYAAGEFERIPDDRGSRVRRSSDYDDTGLPPLQVARMQQLMVLFHDCCQLKCGVNDIKKICLTIPYTG